MSTVRAIIRFSFTDSEVGGQRTTALVTAFIQGNTDKSALNYLTKKYPYRYNIEIIELVIQDE